MVTLVAVVLTPIWVRRLGLLLLCTGLLVLQASSIEFAQETSQSSGAVGQAITVLPGGLELLTGGVAGRSVSANTWIRDPQTGTMNSGPALARARVWHSATMLPDGHVLVVGGVDRTGRSVPDIERLDLVAGTSEILPSLTWSGAAHTATLLNGHEVLLAGGIRSGEPSADADILNLDSGLISSVGKLPVPRAYHRADLLADGRVQLWGGRGDDPQVAVSGAMFDPAAHSFADVYIPESDADPLWIAGTDPVDGAENVSLQPRILLRFSRLVRIQSVTPQTLVLTGSSGTVSARVLVAQGRRLAFVTPSARLEPGTTYTLTMNGARDDRGREYPSFTLTFTTEDTRALGTPNDDDDLFDPFAKGLWQRWRMERPESPWQRLSPLTAPPGVTALAGQVLRLNGSPLAGVTMRLGGQSTVTDATGRFLLVNESLSTGWHTLTMDGRTAIGRGATYGRFDVGVRITPNKTSVLPYTIWMPKIDTRHAVRIPFPTNREIVVTTPMIPGLELHLAPGTVITDDDGHVVREVSITPIPVDRTPFPLPVGVDVPIYFTIQPGGAYVAVTGTSAHLGAHLIYPNYRGRSPGTRMEFWHYQPAAGKGWYVYGGGQVSVNGQQVVPDPGVSLYTFTGAMVAPPSLAPGNGPLPGNDDKDGDPVDLGTGLFVLRKADLVLHDVLPLTLRRTYRPNDSISRAFGIGATHDYDMFLVGTTSPYTYVDLILPDGGRVHYDRISPGTGWADAVYEHTSTPTIFFKSRVSWNGAGWTVALKDGSRISFRDGLMGTRSMQGAATRIQDRYGNAIVLMRDANANLTRITSPNGRFIDLTYDGNYRVTQARDNIGRTVQYTYDASGRLWKVTNAAGGITQYTYDSSHRMLTITDARGITYLTNQYDANGRVTQQTQADSSTFTFAYTLDANGAITQTDVTDPRGTVRRVTFDSIGYLTSDTRAVGQPQERTITYARQSGTNLVTAVVDGLGRHTTFAYDDHANVTSVTRLAGTASALTTTYTYESVFSQVASATDPLSHTIALTYDASGNLTNVADALGNNTAFTYNAAGQLLSMASAAGTTYVGYDRGDATTLTDPLGRIMSRYVDAAGRGVRFTNPLGQATTCAYDALDNVKSCTDAGGDQSFTYDGNSNLLTVTDALSHATTYTYDSMDRAATRTDPLSRGESYTYDANGNIQQVTDRKGQLTTYSYDRLDRLHTVTYHDASTTTYTYDAGDRVTQIADSVGGTIGRTYDLLNRLTQEVTPEGSVSYTYDAASRRATMTVGGQASVNYAYDAADRLTGISQGSSTVGLSYDGANRRTALTLPNGITAAYVYDAASELTSITYTLGSTIVGDLTYTYDGAGQRIASSGSLARTGLPASLSSAVYDAANQIVTWAGVPLSHDSNGNLTGDGLTSYSWNARNQLVGLSGGTSASFVYDAVGRRRSKAIGGTTTHFLYDAHNIVQELASGGTPTANLLTGRGIDEIFLRTGAGGTDTFLADVFGNIVELADASGVLQTHYTYDPFGTTTTSGASSTNAQQFAGRENDGTGLYFQRARYYSPQLQRFVSEDPLGLLADINLYRYVGDAPTQATDPFGLQAVNRSGSPAWGKPEEGKQPVCIPPGGYYPGPLDGIAIPSNPGFVYKIPNGTGVIIEPPGSPITVFPPPMIDGRPVPIPMPSLPGTPSIPVEIYIPPIPGIPGTRFPGYGWISWDRMLRDHLDWLPLHDAISASPGGGGAAGGSGGGGGRKDRPKCPGQ